MNRPDLLEELAALVAEVLPTMRQDAGPCSACGEEQEAAGFVLRREDAEALRALICDIERSKREAA